MASANSSERKSPTKDKVTSSSSHKKKRKRHSPKKFKDGPRNHAVTIMLTEREHTLLQQHLLRKKVTNRSRYLRSILLKDILTKLNASPPSLFDHIPAPPPPPEE